VCLLGVVAAAFAMAHTSLQKGHVAVNFIVRNLSRKVRSEIEIVTGVMGILFFAMIGYESALYAEKGKGLGGGLHDASTSILPLYLVDASWTLSP